MRKINRFFYKIYMYLFKNDSARYIHLFWFNKESNFGDTINPYLVEKISNKEILWAVPKYSLVENYLCIGSIIHEASTSSIIWGSGFITDNPKRVISPKRVCAVRGPKSRQVYLDRGIDCPEVYGDPALLLPRFYNPSVKVKYKVGIIPHYVDKKSPWLEKFNKNSEVNIINIQQEDVLNFIDELKECEIIVSSSLHGLIVADAYGVPSIWIQISDKIIGNNFKFYDYFESVGRVGEKVALIDNNTSLDEVLESKKEYKVDIDLDLLIKACPFLN